MSFVSAIKRGSSIPQRILARRTYSSALTREEINATKTEASAGLDTWKKVSLYVTIPLCLVFGVIATKEEMEHIHHTNEHPPELVPYKFMNVHTKDFPWGNGKHTLFFNPVFNPLSK
ncbi:hypothetical protein BB559_002106 [Furculomyces boomerangus]|uniref:Cytochrome c oxidase subunit n=1 Tax=Furculomyces boomerangus TaxID=61424 RepID=A0A2T9YY29_9FUNG|nr:hypothetical protein BB559_002106 [Furculomyces boomerangus]